MSLLLAVHSRRIPLLAASLILVISSCWILYDANPLNFASPDILLDLGERLFPINASNSFYFGRIKGSATLHPLHSVSTNTFNSSNPCYRTLGIASKIYVLSLPRRTDRRTGMDRLRSALSLDWTYADAVSSDDPKVQQILHDVRHRREAYITNNQESFSWPLEIEENSPTLDILSSSKSASTYPALELLSSQRLHDTEGLSPDPEPLTCATRNLTSGVPYLSSIPDYMLLTPAKIACWYSHLQVIQSIAESVQTPNPVRHSGYEIGAEQDTPPCEDVTLVLEDDVDIEWDIRERLRGVWNALPNDWDIVFLGHCWSNETYHPALSTTLTTLPFGTYPSRRTSIHPSYAPKCTHAYALTRSGARKISSYLNYPPFAYSRALDQALAWLVLSGKLQAFSIVPSVVVQRKVLSSDIISGDQGLGSTWRDELENGVLAS